MSEDIIDTSGIVRDFANLHGDRNVPLHSAIMDVLMSRQREEIVRCRDCEFFSEDKLGAFCTLFDFEDVNEERQREGFCAWGVRKGTNYDDKKA